MPRVAVVDNQKILELKEKIHDERYIQGAIQRIALVLSNKLIEIKETGYEYRTY
ncbi:hypothetical protein K7I13_14275 [Brucepastera parasyntrophica]|uniref:hypothetical protein n=1 Tax=Brucepastera parasyntrophica TaxID=2880008 RepID=UPI00210871D0|nr:hypothetical protein [Brucepastera parasyntrophica]ULQ59607.1 hypothetical protein K7I13_14275 [Brucepastera parasyntrophica]